MRKCIFCGKSENEFCGNNDWTIEHIIPEALGNNSLKLYNVCKMCNNGLGTYVDNYFVNHPIVKCVRQELGLAGKSGKIPNAFPEVTDDHGRQFRLEKSIDCEQRLKVIPSIENENGLIKATASTQKDAIKMIEKHFSRKNLSGNTAGGTMFQIKQVQTSEIKNEFYSNDIEFDINRFSMEALKIAYEFAVYSLGEAYLNDDRAIEIRDYLNEAIAGKMKNACSVLNGVSPFDHGLEEVEEVNSHLLIIWPENNELYAYIFIFLKKVFSFSVLISRDAGRYKNKSHLEIIDV